MGQLTSRSLGFCMTTVDALRSSAPKIDLLGIKLAQGIVQEVLTE
jgi:hypothetical protein